MWCSCGHIQYFTFSKNEGSVWCQGARLCVFSEHAHISASLLLSPVDAHRQFFITCVLEERGTWWMLQDFNSLWWSVLQLCSINRWFYLFYFLQHIGQSLFFKCAVKIKLWLDLVGTMVQTSVFVFRIDLHVSKKNKCFTFYVICISSF